MDSKRRRGMEWDGEMREGLGRKIYPQKQATFWQSLFDESQQRIFFFSEKNSLFSSFTWCWGCDGVSGEAAMASTTGKGGIGYGWMDRHGLIDRERGLYFLSVCLFVLSARLCDVCIVLH